MIANGHIKALLVIKHEYSIRIIRIKNKKEPLVSIKWKDDFRDIFQ